MTSDGRELAAGTVLDEYRIEGTLGSGGFGVTYLATDISLGRRVAVEEYLPLDWASRASDGTVGPRTQSASSDYAWGLSRFLDEARALAQFDHPHIVRVYRVFEALGTAYMVTEYVEGRTLSASLAEEGPWSEDRVRGLLASLISGLEPVHAADLIHRDIKPENVMLRADGSAVLIDFGSARQAMGTKSRSVMSVLTPGYAPIEQYGGDIRKQGPWTDIYALGAVVYELLSGRRPQDATARAEDDELLPVREAAAGRVSVGLSSAVDAALSVFRSDRPQDLSSWRALLSSSADAGVVAPPPHPVREAHPEVPSAAGLASPSSPMGSRPVRDAPVVPSGRLFAGAEAAVAGDQGVKVDSWRRRLAVGLASVLVVPTLGVMLRVWLGDSPAPAVRQSEERRPEDAETALGLNRDARRLIQMGLASEGFDVGVLDGVFGPVTRSALRDWQAGAGEAVTGRLTAATAAALRTAGEAEERRLADEAAAVRQAEPRQPGRIFRDGAGAGAGAGGAGAGGGDARPPVPTLTDRDVLIEFYNATNGSNWNYNRNWNSSAPLEQWRGVRTDQTGRVTYLDLVGNQFSGSIPSSLGSLTNLERLDLVGNQFSGSIPSSLGSLTNLERLDLVGNQFSGSIPSFLGSLTNLETLYLYGNQFSGSIPSFLGSLTNLETLDLDGNQLSGSIPSSLGSLTNLEHLSLDRNQFSGSIPSSLGSLTNLEHLSLDRNQLSGSIPSSLGSLTNLEHLSLDRNQLSGSIPSSLGSLTNLGRLSLDGNQLSGSIPSSLGSLTNLEWLSLTGNQLSGSIPSSLGSLTNLDYLFLHNNRLSGSIPAPLCQFGGRINPQQGGVNLPCESSSSTAQGLAGLSVSDARAEEAAGAAVAFAVTLSRAASTPVTVDYATRDGSARAGEDTRRRAAR